MPKRWVVASVVAGLLVAVGVVVVVVPTRSGEAGRAVAAAQVGVATDAPSGTTTESTTTQTTTTTTSTTTTTVAPPADPALAGRIKPGVTREGVATFYDSDGGGACLYDPGPDPLTAAMNWADYENSNACGAYVLVRAANGKSITVRITNLCPAPCRVGQLDLSAEAFAMLAEPVRGEIPITWELVSPDLSSRIALRYKTGSSQWWCGIQVIDHRNPVARLEVRTSRGWKSLSRTEYNYFLAEDGAGCGGAVAITDSYGQRLEVEALPVKPDVVQRTSVQFDRH
ncbi:expansin EXLX1 family cellulose-binding protein [Actinosynnema sp. CA-248983]